MNPREAAIDLIRVYVERGDSLKSLQLGQMGCYSTDYGASIGGHIFPPEYFSADNILRCPNNLIKKVPTSKILVERVGERIVNEVFSLQEIFSSIKNREPRQLSLI